MRTLTYVFTDGTTTTSYAEALASGKEYKATLVEEKSEKTAVTPKFAEMLATYGMVRPIKKYVIGG